MQLLQRVGWVCHVSQPTASCSGGRVCATQAFLLIAESSTNHEVHSTAEMEHGAVITDLSPEVFTLIVDRLLPVSEDGSRTDALDFACLRLSSRGVRQLCDAAVRRLDLRHRSSDEMQALLHRFTGAVIPRCLRPLCQRRGCTEYSCMA
jgi:hypothetical protein